MSQSIWQAFMVEWICEDNFLVVIGHDDLTFKTLQIRYILTFKHPSINKFSSKLSFSFNLLSSATVKNKDSDPLVIIPFICLRFIDKDFWRTSPLKNQYSYKKKCIKKYHFWNTQNACRSKRKLKTKKGIK